MIEATQIESLIEKHDRDDTAIEPITKGDKCNIFVLFVLYTLQGVPVGLSYAIPIILQNKYKTSFSDQAKFSLALWPFSMKLLWAPLVDSLYVRKFGRRKSWLIPLQCFLGIFFLVTGFNINEWLMNADKPNITALTVMFFILNFLAASQDIVIDGWAITMLKRKNVRYAAMCNTAGVDFGIFLGFIFLTMLMSETFWNTWRSSPQPVGIVSMQEYLYVCGVVCIVVTTLVAIFKTEIDQVTETGVAIRISIFKTYKLLFRILKLPSVKMLAITLLTVFISFASVESAYKLKLVDGGITKDQIASIELLHMPMRLCLPILVTRFTSKEKPLKIFYNTVPYRLLVGVVLTIVIYFTPTFLTTTGPLLIAFKIFLVLIYIMQQILHSFMLQTALAFFANIADPRIGGTMMTLLGTIRLIGYLGSNTAALRLMDILTFKNCSKDYTNMCSSENGVQNLCRSLAEHNCEVKIDGFYVETIMCTIYGVLWYCIFRKTVSELQSKNVNKWYVEIKMKEPL